MSRFQVAIVGASLGSLFTAAALARGGCQGILVVQTAPPTHDLGVLWPGLTEHWGMLAETLGFAQTEALLRVIQRSRQLLIECPAWSQAQGRGGAVMQLASNATEMQELTTHLRWLSQLWSRRLMSAGSASNYMSVNHIEGAAFVPDCCSCQSLEFHAAMHRYLESLGVEIRQDSTTTIAGDCVHTQQGKVEAEVVVVGAAHESLKKLGLTGNWLFPQMGVIFHCESVSEPWNQALVGIESQRGHLLIRQGPERGWMIGGMAPENDVETLSQLAGERLSSLEGVVTSGPRGVVYTCTADGLPAVGPLPGSPRSWLMAGFAGRSWSLAPALGEQVALALLGHPSPWLSALPCLRPARWLGR